MKLKKIKFFAFSVLFFNCTTIIANQCPINNSIEDINFNKQNDLKIASDLAYKDKNNLVFSGNVLAHDATRALKTTKLYYDHDSEQITTLNASTYKQNDLLLKTDGSINLNRKNDTLSTKSSQFYLKKVNGYGTTKAIEGKNRHLYLDEIVYTHCDPEDPLWQIKASEAIYIEDKNRMVLKDASFNIADFPLFWTPYISFSLSDRDSGLLAADFSYKTAANGKDKFVYNQPYYFNLAPNRDLTSSIIFDSLYGQLLSNEYRYLEKSDQANFKFYWLANDKTNFAKERWYLDYHHLGYFALLEKQTYYQLNLLRASDENFTEDFKPFDNEENIRLNSNLSFWQNNKLGYFYAAFQDSQRLKSNGNYYVKNTHIKASFKPIKIIDDWMVALISDYAKFKRDDEVIISSNPVGNRFNNQLKIYKNYSTLAYSIQPELSLIDRYYDFDNQKTGQSKIIHQQYTQFKVDNQFYFEKNINDQYYQDLNLRALLLYTNANQDQNQIPVFDTSLLSPSANSLFADNAYSGLDRQSEERKIALSISTALYDQKKSKKIIDGQIAQAYYFNEQNKLPNNKKYSNIYLGLNTYINNLVLGLNLEIDPATKVNKTIVSKRYNIYQNSSNPHFLISYYQDSSNEFILSQIAYQFNQSNLSLENSYSVLKEQTDSLSIKFKRDSCCYKIGVDLSKIRKTNNLFETVINFYIEFDDLTTLRFR